MPPRSPGQHVPPRPPRPPASTPLIITTVDKVKLLGVIIDSKLKFDEHVKSLCIKAKRNINVLSSVAMIVDQLNFKLLYNSFLMSNFRYFLLICMLSGKTANKEINRAHKRALSILLRDYDASLMSCLSKMRRKPFIFMF